MNRVKNCTHDKCAGLLENLPGFRLQNWTSLWPALNPLSVRLIEMSIKIESTLMLLIFLFFQQSVRLYDVQNNNMRLKYNHANAVLDCCFQDGVHSYSGGLDSTLKVLVDFILYESSDERKSSTNLLCSLTCQKC